MSAAHHESVSRRVAVIGGGITGLAAAHRLRELDPAVEVDLFEASDSLGGVLQTHREQGYLLELSADNFITNVPWALDLCRRIGYDHQLVETRSENRRALVVHRGRLVPVPEGFLLMAPNKLWPIVTTPILSWRGKLRLLAELIVPRCREAGDESLASFVRRRLGRETFERLVQPLVGGIYTADSEQLSLAATLPRFQEMERRHGSLIRATWKDRLANKSGGSGARYTLFMAPREGMSDLIDALVAKIPSHSLHLNSPIARLERTPEGRWLVHLVTPNPELSTANSYSAIILAAPAPAASRILADAAPSLAADLARIPYAGTAIALVGYRRDQITHPLDGFGFVVPEVEQRTILAASFSSQKFDGRAPAGHVLLRVFLGGAARPALVHLEEDKLRQIVIRELGELLGASGEPELFQIARWGGAMPQYHLGHLDLVAKIEAQAAAFPGLALAGNAYHGVGVPNCIHSGELAAERVVKT